ncbi:MAG TPA: PA-phosphatase, partial [Arthrobacter sp.]|nr:PA-phosphatase [Arthrobacter sp.]
MRSMLRTAPGRLGKLDRKLVRAVSNFPGGHHDDFFRRLSAAANKGKLWFA